MIELAVFLPSSTMKSACVYTLEINTSFLPQTATFVHFRERIDLQPVAELAQEVFHETTGVTSTALQFSIF